jgi:hypothetical protein
LEGKKEMGRELKRVPLNFEWEIGKLWSGYVNPHSWHKCLKCDGMGESEESRQLNNEWYAFEDAHYKPNPFREGTLYNATAWSNNLTQEDVDALLEADRLWDFTRVPITDKQREIVKQNIADGENSWLPFNNGYRPTPKEVNEWNMKGMGHDSINAWVCIKARLKREGKPSKCPNCKGSGSNWQHPTAEQQYERWENYDPPTGEGFQLWTTTSEGAPMTPVFETLEALCEFCEAEKVSVFASNTATKDEWFRMLSDDFVTYQQGNITFI